MVITKTSDPVVIAKFWRKEVLDTRVTDIRPFVSASKAFYREEEIEDFTKDSTHDSFIAQCDKFQIK